MRISSFIYFSCYAVRVLSAMMDSNRNLAARYYGQLLYVRRTINVCLIQT